MMAARAGERYDDGGSEGGIPPLPAGLAGRTAWWRRWEAPTWAVVVAVYGGFGLVTWFYDVLPWWAVLPLGGWFVCWQGSLQHEAVHGHPTRWRLANTLIAGAPLWLWLPYPIYRESHTAHHRGDDVLTLPGADPESYYLAAARWARLGPLRRGLLWFRNTLLGRLAIGPLYAYGELAKDEWRRLAAGDRRHLAAWAWHVPAVALVLGWAIGVCGIPFWAYVALFAYPGLSLTLLRSFAEHRPAAEPAHRTVVVEAAWPWRLLFLDNNYHAPHHARPSLAWYDLGAYYRANRAAFLARNGGYRFAGYGAEARRFLIRPKDAPVHPLATA